MVYVCNTGVRWGDGGGLREVESARGEAVAGGLVADCGGAEGEGDEGREGAAELGLASEPSGARLVVVEG